MPAAVLESEAREHITELACGPRGAVLLGSDMGVEGGDVALDLLAAQRLCSHGSQRLSQAADGEGDVRWRQGGAEIQMGTGGRVETPGEVGERGLEPIEILPASHRLPAGTLGLAGERQDARGRKRTQRGIQMTGAKPRGPGCSPLGERRTGDLGIALRLAQPIRRFTPRAERLHGHVVGTPDARDLDRSRHRRETEKPQVRQAFGDERSGGASTQDEDECHDEQHGADCDRDPFPENRTRHHGKRTTDEHHPQRRVPASPAPCAIRLERLDGFERRTTVLDGSKRVVVVGHRAYCRPKRGGRLRARTREVVTHAGDALLTVLRLELEALQVTARRLDDRTRGLIPGERGHHFGWQADTIQQLPVPALGVGERGRGVGCCGALLRVPSRLGDERVELGCGPKQRGVDDDSVGLLHRRTALTTQVEQELLLCLERTHAFLGAVRRDRELGRPQTRPVPPRPLGLKLHAHRLEAFLVRMEAGGLGAQPTQLPAHLACFGRERIDDRRATTRLEEFGGLTLE